MARLDEVTISRTIVGVYFECIKSISWGFRGGHGAIGRRTGADWIGQCVGLLPTAILPG
jgi:hypothetical protein